MTIRKDGRYQEQVTVTIKGRQVQKYFYGHSKAEVNRKIAEWRNEEESHAKGAPFSSVADDWWEQVDIADNTKRPYKAALTRAKGHFKETPIQTITPANVSSFLRQTIKTHKMADKTAKTQLSVLNQIFRFAVETGDVQTNPARDIKVPSGLTKEGRDVASDEDIKKIRSMWDTEMGRMANWFLYTGLRRCELLALTWDDVDMESRKITVSKTLYRGEDGKMHVKTPKTDAGYRPVPILNALAEHIAPGTGLVFPNENGTYITENSFSKRWANFQKAAGITCTPHQLRHATATMYCEAVDDGKLSLQDVQRIIGHSQYQTTMDVYNHYRKQREEKARNAVLDLDFG